MRQQRQRQAEAARRAEDNRLIAAVLFGVLSLVVFYVATSGDGTELLRAADTLTASLGGRATGSAGGGQVIVVVGGGLAGLTASIELAERIRQLQDERRRQRAERYAADAELARLQELSGEQPDETLNVTVLLVEKEGVLGGNSAKASSGMNAVNTRVQRGRGVADTPALLADDTLASGHGLSDPLLVEALARGALQALDYVENRTGLAFDLLSQLGGHSVPRTHRPAPSSSGRPVNVGFETVRALITLLRANYSDVVRVRLNSRVARLLVDEQRRTVTGVLLQPDDSSEQTTTIEAAAVLLTTGGYAADRHGFLQAYVPDTAALPTTNGPWATGDGMRLAQALGAQLVHMDQVQIHPTAFVDPANPASPSKFLAPEALRGAGGLLLNADGRRFVNELGLRDAVSARIRQQPGGEAYLLLNAAAVALYSAPALTFYRSKGFIVDHDNATAAARALGIDARVLADTLSAYGADQPDPFGKTVFPVLYAPDQPLSVMKITPALHYTMGGVAIDPVTAAVRFVDPAHAYAGLFAAGETTGGLHGANRLAGNSLLECVVFGRIAAASALQFVLA